jgi:FAD dependent oxidoreductase
MRLRGRDIAVRGDQHQLVVEVMQMRREPTDSARLGPLEWQAALARMAEEVFDVVIVGGGVTGVGTALDAATRGLSVALVEAVDFAAGTSSRSSKLIHGGLRYLSSATSPWSGRRSGSGGCC